jgi:hypothetical protein
MLLLSFLPFHVLPPSMSNIDPSIGSFTYYKVSEGQYSRKTLQALCETSDRSGQDILLGTLDTLDENDIVGRSSSDEHLNVSLKSRVDLSRDLLGH